MVLLGGVHQTAAPLADTQPQLWRRYLGLIFDGIRPLFWSHANLYGTIDIHMDRHLELGLAA
jgi:hypothetical protein